MAAVSRADALVVKALLQAGADPNLRGRGNTPLQVAAVHTKPLSAAEECVRALLAVPGTALDAQFKGYTAEERARTMPQRAFLADLIGEEVRCHWSLGFFGFPDSTLSIRSLVCATTHSRQKPPSRPSRELYLE